MESIEDQALKVLKGKGPLRASDLGWFLWGETSETAMRGEGSHRQNKYCRSAGKVLRRLERKGLASSSLYGKSFLWRAH